MKSRYIAIDFETANAKRVSACSVGVAVIEDGRVVETFPSLIKPPPDYDTFAPLNVRIHGITSELVESTLNVSAELTGLPIINCHRCNAPIRSELVGLVATCPWCDAPLIA